MNQATQSGLVAKPVSVEQFSRPTIDEVGLSRPVETPLVLSSTFEFESSEDVIRFQEGGRGHEYRRYSTPNVDLAEAKLACLEGAESVILYPSGMAAESGAFLGLLKRLAPTEPCEVLMGQDCYRRTRELLTDELARCNIQVRIVPNDKLGNLEDYISENTKIAFFEAPTNPYLRVLSFEALTETAQTAKRRFGTEIVTIVDSTFGSPYNQKPLEHGIDLVIHSATKYLGGHNDLVLGMVAGREELLAPLRKSRGNFGTMAAPDEASRLERSLQTFNLRMEAQNQAGLLVADFLNRHPKIERVWYPGLQSHPDYEIARSQMTGFGGVISFEYQGNARDTMGLVDQVANSGIASIGASFGGVRGIIEQPLVMSYWNYEPEQRQKIGIKDNLVRYSVGTEVPAEQLIRTLEGVLA